MSLMGKWMCKDGPQIKVAAHKTQALDHLWILALSATKTSCLFLLKGSYGVRQAACLKRCTFWSDATFLDQEGSVFYNLNSWHSANFFLLPTELTPKLPRQADLMLKCCWWEGDVSAFFKKKVPVDFVALTEENSMAQLLLRENWKQFWGYLARKRMSNPKNPLPFFNFLTRVITFKWTSWI